MARKTQVTLVDDLDGGKAEHTVTFGLDGTTFEIDLSNRNAAAMRKLLGPYLQAGRKMTKPTRGRASRPYSRVKTDVDPAAVRAWAIANGINVSARGRVAAEVIERFRAAGN